MNRNRLSHVSGLADHLSRLEPLLILLLAPFFIFPRPKLTPWLMALVPLLWLLRWLAQGRIIRQTPLDAPLLVILLMVVVSLWATFDLHQSFPKLCGIYLGIALFYALRHHLRTERAIWLTTIGIFVGGVALAGVSLLGTRWSAGKVPLLASWLEPLYERFPTMLQGIPRAEQGFNANQVGGSLTLFIPLAVALLLHQLRHRRLQLGWFLTTLGLGGALGLMSLVLVLTQSRMAYLAVAFALLILIASLGRWPRRAVLILVILGVGAVIYRGPAEIARAIFGVWRLDTLTGELSLWGRLEIWKRSLRVIQDHPLTGIGFDNLFPVIHARYPTFFISPGRDATHAHNFFLQTALDLGLPGLFAFIWLLIALGSMLWRARRHTTSPGYRTLATGLFLGLLAQLLFGLADAIALGQKPGIFLWAYLGLGTTLWTNVMEAEGTRGARDKTSHIISYVSRLASYVSLHPVRIACLSLVLFSIAWGYGRVSRARTWASLLRADMQMMQSLTQNESQDRVLQETQKILAQTRGDLKGIQTEFALPLTLAPHLGWVPGYGEDLRAVPILLRIGLQMTEAGEQVIEIIQPVMSSPTDDAMPEVAIGALESNCPQLERALSLLDSAHRARQTISSHQLSPRLAGLVDRLDQMLPLMENGLRGTLALPEILGASEPRTYLILVQNEDELRATGGFISGVARVTLDRGRIVKLDFEDSYSVDDFSHAYPVAPKPLREVWGPVPWLFRDSNWNPDFPTTAQRAVELYRVRYEDVKVDGVVALDQQAIKRLVTALEPLDVVAYPQPVTGDNVLQAARDAWAPSEEEGLTREWWQQRKRFMGRVLVTAVRKMQNESEHVSLTNAAQAVLQSLEERHLFIYLLEDGPAAQTLQEAGWDGAIQDVPRDYLMTVDTNLGFNKVNPLITERLTYTVDLRDQTEPRATLTLVHQHTGARTGKPCRHGSRYDLTYEQMMQRCYWDYLRVYVPQGSQLKEATSHLVPGELLLTGHDRPGQADVLPDQAGKSVFATFFVLGRGERTKTKFSYDLPPYVVGQAENAWHYRLYVQKQGGTRARAVRVVLHLPSEAEAVSPIPTQREGNRLVYQLNLQADTTISVRWRPALTP